MKRGKIASLADFRKAKASGECVNPHLAGDGAFEISTAGKVFTLGVVPAVSVGLATATVVCSNSNSQTNC